MFDPSGAESIGRWTCAVATTRQHKSITADDGSVVPKSCGVEPRGAKVVVDRKNEIPTRLSSHGASRQRSIRGTHQDAKASPALDEERRLLARAPDFMMPFYDARRRRKRP